MCLCDYLSVCLWPGSAAVGAGGGGGPAQSEAALCVCVTICLSVCGQGVLLSVPEAVEDLPSLKRLCVSV